MSNPHKVSHRTVTMMLLLSAAIFTGVPAASAAPPHKREPSVARGLQKVGDFFFKFARNLERSGLVEDRNPEIIYEIQRTDSRRSEDDPRLEPRSGLVLPPGYRDGDEFRNPSSSRTPVRTLRPPPAQQTTRGGTFTPPTYQLNPQPYPLYPTKPVPRSSLSLPVQPAAPSGGSVPRQAPPGSGTSASVDPPSPPPIRTKEMPEVEPVPPPTPATPAFATPIPEHRGFVYPPGVEPDLKNMIDVRDFAPGQKVRDPRTGKIFLVPPK